MSCASEERVYRENLPHAFLRRIPFLQRTPSMSEAARQSLNELLDRAIFERAPDTYQFYNPNHTFILVRGLGVELQPFRLKNPSTGGLVDWREAVTKTLYPREIAFLDALLVKEPARYEAVVRLSRDAEILSRIPYSNLETLFKESEHHFKAAFKQLERWVEEQELRDVRLDSKRKGRGESYVVKHNLTNLVKTIVAYTEHFNKHYHADGYEYPLPRLSKAEWSEILGYARESFYEGLKELLARINHDGEFIPGSLKGFPFEKLFNKGKNSKPL